MLWARPPIFNRPRRWDIFRFPAPPVMLADPLQAPPMDALANDAVVNTLPKSPRVLMLPIDGAVITSGDASVSFQALTDNTLIGVREYSEVSLTFPRLILAAALPAPMVIEFCPSVFPSSSVPTVPA